MLQGTCRGGQATRALPRVSSSQGKNRRCFAQRVLAPRVNCPNASTSPAHKKVLLTLQRRSKPWSCCSLFFLASFSTLRRFLLKHFCAAAALAAFALHFALSSAPHCKRVYAAQRQRRRRAKKVAEGALVKGRLNRLADRRKRFLHTTQQVATPFANVTARPGPKKLTIHTRSPSLDV